MAKVSKTVKRQANAAMSAKIRASTKALNDRNASADKMYADLLNDLHDSMDLAISSSAGAVSQAEAIVASMAGAPSHGKAREAAAKLRTKLLDLIDTNKAIAAGFVAETKRTIASLGASARTIAEGHRQVAMAELSGKELEKRKAKEEEALRLRIRSLYTGYMKTQKELGSAALKQLNQMSRDDIEAELKRINSSLGDIDKRQADIQAAGEKLAAEEKAREEAKHVKDLEKELARLNHSLVRRLTIDPLTDSLKRYGSAKAKAFRDATGITKITDFMEAERQRKSRISELRGELSSINENRLRQSLGGRQQALQSVLTTLGVSPDDAASMSGAQPDLAKKSTEIRQTVALEKLAKAAAKPLDNSLMSDLGAIGTAVAAALAALMSQLGLSQLAMRLGDWFKTKAPGIAPGARVPGSVSEGAARGTNAGAAKTAGKSTSLWTRASTAVSEAADSAKASVSNAAKATAEGAKAAGRWAYSRMGTAGQLVMDYSQKAGKSLVAMGQSGMAKISDFASRAASSRGGQWVGKNLNRLGRLATAVDVLSGLHAEATGKPLPDDIDWVDMLMSPMTSGRVVGHAFNKWFEDRMGTSVGSWLYDYMNEDAEGKAVLADMSSHMGSTPNTTNSKAALPPSAARTSPNSVVRVPGSLGGTAMVSQTPSMTARAIPDVASDDFHLNAVNMGAF